MTPKRATRASAWSLWIPEFWVSFLRDIVRVNSQYRHGLMVGHQIHRLWVARAFLPSPDHRPVEAIKLPVEWSWIGCWSMREGTCPEPDETAWIYFNPDTLQARWFGQLPRRRGDSWYLSPQWVTMSVHILSPEGTLDF